VTGQRLSPGPFLHVKMWMAGIRLDRTRGRFGYRSGLTPASNELLSEFLRLGDSAHALGFVIAAIGFAGAGERGLR
jgi:hypothetical protein